MEVPESRSAGVDEIREMASTIKTEVLAELEGRTNFISCNTLTSQVSKLLQVDLPVKGEKSHIVPKTAACRERCFDDVREVLNATKVNRTLLCERGKSDCRRRRSRSNMHAFCQGNIGHVVGGHGRSV